MENFHDHSKEWGRRERDHNSTIRNLSAIACQSGGVDPELVNNALLVMSEEQDYRRHENHKDIETHYNEKRDLEREVLSLNIRLKALTRVITKRDEKIEHLTLERDNLINKLHNNWDPLQNKGD